MAKGNVIPFAKRPPKRVFKDQIAARLPETSVCGSGHIIAAGSTCGQCR